MCKCSNDPNTTICILDKNINANQLDDESDIPADSMSSTDMVRSDHENSPYYDEYMDSAGNHDQLERIMREGQFPESIMGHFEPMKFWGAQGQNEEEWECWSISSEQKWYERLYRHQNLPELP